MARDECLLMALLRPKLEGEHEVLWGVLSQTRSIGIFSAIFGPDGGAKSLILQQPVSASSSV